MARAACVSCPRPPLMRSARIRLRPLGHEALSAGALASLRFGISCIIGASGVSVDQAVDDQPGGQRRAKQEPYPAQNGGSTGRL